MRSCSSGAESRRLGEWSIPGGRLEWGERAADAALRELREETGVEARLIGLVDVVDGIFQSRETDVIWSHYLLVDYVAEWIAGEPRAGDDAADARFFHLDDLDDLGLWPETVRVIRLASGLRARA
jgi:8-oxo-dGTP diphosphatase